MTEQTTKLRVRLGAAEIDYEGAADFLKQEIMPTVDKMIQMVEKRADLQRSPEVRLLNGHLPNTTQTVETVDATTAQLNSNDTPATREGKALESLSSCLKAANATTNQVQRYLATAAWLYQRGETKLNTLMISKALQENHQKKLTNASNCLNQNVSKGFCEKTNDGFFITPEGWQALGLPQ